MAGNPNPSRITNPMWWFVEEWERLEPETVYAGSWGDFKPGYHTDYVTSKKHPEWQPDYSIQLADDKVGGTPNEKFGAAVDITFPSAQNGNFTNIRKYSDRVRAAWKARDPRLQGWREVLCNSSDGDSGADGYDFVSWTERTPDDTHKWHIHFSCLRKYVNVLSVFEAMMSVLRGESLAQWQARKDDDVPKAINTTKGYWFCQGGIRNVINDGDDMAKVTEVYGNVCWPKADPGGFPTPQIDLPVSQGGKGWSWDEIDRLLGRPYVPPSSGGGGSVTDHTHDFEAMGTSGPPIPS